MQQAAGADIALWPLLRKWWWAFTVAALAASACAYALSGRLTKSYSAQETLLVGPVNTDVGLDAAGTLTTTYAQLATSKPVLRWAIAGAGAHLTPEQLQSSVSATSNTVTRLVTVNVANEDPVLAAKLANAIGTRLATLATQSPQGASPALTQLMTQPEVHRLPLAAQHDISTAAGRVLAFSPEAGRVSVVDPAVPASSPSSPNRKLIAILAALVGLAVAGAFAMTRELRARERLTEEEIIDIRDGAFVGALDLVHSRKPDRALPVEARPDSSFAEQYRVLAAKFRLLDEREPVKSLLVVDATDGKTAAVVAANLAATLREGDHRVLLVDANTSSAGATSLLGLQGSPGYTEAMADPETLLNGHLRELCVERSEDLLVLPRGSSKNTQVTERRLEEALARLQTVSEVVVVSGPPILRSKSALTWAQAVDATLFVVDPDALSRGDVLAALRDLELVRARKLGLVLSRIARRPVFS
jgi:capsular polysaccharide biosynthesis protein/Mrp family chromosome partitioning ATPase